MRRRRRKPGRTQVERRNETQAAILSASIGLLAENGYAGFSVSRVASPSACRAAPRALYFAAATTEAALRFVPSAIGATAMAVQQNTDHIQTTHIGSLPRPHNLLDLLKAKYTGQPYDESKL